MTEHEPVPSLPPAPPAGPPPAAPPTTGIAPAAAGPAPYTVPAAPVDGIRPATRPTAGGFGKWAIVLLIPVFAIAAFAGGVAAGRSDAFGGQGAASQPTAAPPTENANLDLIAEAWRTIHENYVDAKNLDDQELAYGAIRGLTEAVGDEGHTSFMTAEEAKAVDQSLSGTFVGIGVQVNDEDGHGPTISTIIPNTPASQSTLRRGDRILAVDGWKTEGHTVEEVVSRVRGPEGEPVTLTIGRDGAADFDVTIVRKKFDLPLVSWAMVPGQPVAMIRLEQFATGASTALREAITAAKEQGATGILLDLRGNPGGYVNEAVAVASQFVGDGIVYRSIDASGATKDVPVESGGLWTEGPLVVLADGNSASSSEIVTGAIQDAKRGRVVGEKTFGTGTVLGRFDLSDGSSMRIGVERWLTRSGRPIWHEGLEPDVKVELAPEVERLIPDALREMTKAQLEATPDTQVIRALEELKAAG